MTHFSAIESTALAAADVQLQQRRAPAPARSGTRVIGYHRPGLASFNIGKQGEHAERQFFAEQ